MTPVLASRLRLAGKTGYLMLWRQAVLAVELRQRAAEITGQVLPGSYRPGSLAAPPGGDCACDAWRWL